MKVFSSAEGLAFTLDLEVSFCIFIHFKLFCMECTCFILYVISKLECIKAFLYTTKSTMSAIFSYYIVNIYLHYKCAIYTCLYMRMQMFSCLCSPMPYYNDWHIKVFLEFSVHCFTEKSCDLGHETGGKLFKPLVTVNSDVIIPSSSLFSATTNTSFTQETKTNVIDVPLNRMQLGSWN